MTSRPLRLGLAATLLVAMAAGHYLLQPTGYAWQALAASGLRIGLLLGLLWLAYPDLQNVPGWTWPCFLVAAVVIAWRPRMAILLLPFAGLLWMLRRR